MCLRDSYFIFYALDLMPVLEKQPQIIIQLTCVLRSRYGRKIIFVFCIVLMSVTGVAQAVSNDYITFQFFVFVNALGTSGVYPLAFILGQLN